MEKKIGETGKTGKAGEAGKTVEKADSRLRLWCNRLSPKISLMLVISMLAVFAVLSVFMAVSSVYGSGSRQPDIQHIRTVKIKSCNDSINSINLQKIKEYDDFDE